MAKVFNNVTEILLEDLRCKIKRGSRVSIASPCFSLAAYAELKKELANVHELRFIFTKPTFIKEKFPKQNKEFYSTERTPEKRDRKSVV